MTSLGFNLISTVSPVPNSIPETIEQPNARGEFSSPLAGALFMASLGICQHPLFPRDKKPLLSEWQKKSTTEFEIIRRWSEEFPNCNFGSVAKNDCFVFEADSPDVRKRFEQEGRKFSSRLIIESSKGRGHRWYRYVPEVENIGQSNTTHGDFSLRVSNAFAVSPGSIHPSGSQYRIVKNGVPDFPTPEEITFWKAESEKRSEKRSEAKAAESKSIPAGQRNSTLASEAGRLRQVSQLNTDEIEIVLQRINRERCSPPLPEEEVHTIAQSIGRYEIKDTTVIMGGRSAGSGSNILDESALPEAELKLERLEDRIPPFDPSVVNGIYADFVELITRGTTLAPQFAFGIAKTIVGARMAGKVTFQDLDVEPRFYFSMIGETGSGKGEAWRRMMQIIQPEGLVGNNGLKIINSADSGAGIRDAFLEPPADQPVICYIDEITSLGNKAAGTRNPAILDTIIELADSTSISRVLAKKKNNPNTMRTVTNARFSMVMCGQNGSVYMSALAGRTQLGLYDRLYPEFGTAVEAGDLPAVDRADAYRLLAKLNNLNYAGTMQMQPDAKARIEEFWRAQTPDVRKKARWKKNLMLDAYMSAFGRGVTTAGLEDAEIAVKIFARQIVIRRVCFSTEVPDRVGYYLGLIKGVTEIMERQLKAGYPASAVAKTRRDYEKTTNARRDNEGHIFDRAWRVYQPVWLEKISVRKANGHVYEKFLPIMDD